MDEWEALYAPVLGQSIRALAWCPIWADTPDVVAKLGEASFSYSGGALIVFEPGAQLFLTWGQTGRQFALQPSKKYETSWLPDTLDRVQCSYEAPWDKVRDAKLNRVWLYADSEDENRLVIGSRHELCFENEIVTLWIGTGDEHGIGDHDDLWIGVGVTPKNISGLIEVRSFGNEMA